VVGEDIGLRYRYLVCVLEWVLDQGEGEGGGGLEERGDWREGWKGGDAWFGGGDDGCVLEGGGNWMRG
jgi:hypothetical protein